MSSRSINKVTILGNLTRDPELKYTPNGAPVCTFGVATNRSWTTAEGQIKEDTQYHKIVAWNKVAELCGKLLAKGKKVYVEGRLSYRSYVGKDGQQKSVTEIVLEDFIVFNGARRMSDEVGLKEEVKEEVKEEKKAKTKKEKKEEVEKEPIEEKESVDEEDEIIDPDDIPF
jgi:single-strand DNA-binding protein